MNRIPTEKDFDPYEGDLDAQCAWKNFGGLNRKEAYEKFCGNSPYYQEDFMFMGKNAFEYYFPVIHEFLLHAEPADEDDDCEAWILGCAMEKQIEEHLSTFHPVLVDSIRQLCDVVLDRFSALPLERKVRKRVMKQWRKVADKLS